MDLKCWCGGGLVENTKHVGLPDLEEGVEISHMECTQCWSEVYTEEQKVKNLALIEEAKAAEGDRDFEKEASDYMKARKARGQLIPDGYQDDVMKFNRDFEGGKRAIFTHITEGALGIFCEDMYDRIGVTMDHKQEAELLQILLDRQNVPT